MDVMVFAFFLFVLIAASFARPLARYRVWSACIFVGATFLFLLVRNLELIATVFLLSALLSAFGLQEGFSVVDYRSPSGEWTRALAFLRAYRFRLLLLFAAFHVAFFGLFYSLRPMLLPPVLANQVLTAGLGDSVSERHWVAFVAVSIVAAVLINVNGRRSR